MTLGATVYAWPMASLRPVAATVGLIAALLATPVGAQDDRGVHEDGMQGPFRVQMGRVVDGWRFDLRWQEGPRSRRDGRYHLADVHTPSSTSTPQDCERELGLVARDFVRDFVRGKRLRARDVRRGRDPRVWVGRLEVNGEDLSNVLLDTGLAVPYHDSRRNPELRRWDCSRNDLVREKLEHAGIIDAATPD